MYDAVIVGGGPAGLNAALVLGRCRRRVLLCDNGQPRNAYSHGVNGFLSRDGVGPAELRRIARDELKPYGSVEVRDVAIVDAERGEGCFRLTLADGGRAQARKLLLATGLQDELPAIEGFRELYGQSVWNCPYCDGWEHRDQPLAVYGQGGKGKNFALELTIWSRDLVLCTDGPADLSSEDRDDLAREGIRLVEDPIARLEGGEGGLERIRFRSGEALERKGLFFIYGERQPSELVTKLGVELNGKGVVETGSYERTNVPGLYAAGDASRRVQFAVVAAAEGAMAAFAINTELLHEDLERARRKEPRRNPDVSRRHAGRREA